MKRTIKSMLLKSPSRSLVRFFIVIAAVATALPAQTYTTLFSFDGTTGNPVAALVQAADGFLYGTTAGGGANLNPGAVFKIKPDGTLKIVDNFCLYPTCLNGSGPRGTLIQTWNGDLYGTTAAGGIPNGDGTVFNITPDGTLTTLHSFAMSEGFDPAAGLVQTANGDLYGTTELGGPDDYGTIFKITPGGAVTPLHSFAGTDGYYPVAGLVQGLDGNLYGTTFGGTESIGTVFRMTPDGTLTTIHGFSGPDGEEPYAGLIRASDGNFYGTTTRDSGAGYGTIFKITPSGTLSTMHTFDGTDGGLPYGGLVQANDGDLYGTTAEDGAGGGTIFKISLSGAFTLLHSFEGADSGSYSLAAMIQDTNGSFYGTTQFGGQSNAGAIFSFSVGLGPFVKTLPAAGFVGEVVRILGTDLRNATSVTFDGSPATFVVISPSQMLAAVPPGAHTGRVQVVTPRGTLSSDVAFLII
jgi:uncharacterized repeat protein (TIGR03803 family)